MCVENSPDFEKFALVIQYDLQGFIVKNIQGESRKANDLSHILQRWVYCVNDWKCYHRFHKA